MNKTHYFQTLKMIRKDLPLSYTNVHNNSAEKSDSYCHRAMRCGGSLTLIAESKHIVRLFRNYKKWCALESG